MEVAGLADGAPSCQEATAAAAAVAVAVAVVVAAAAVWLDLGCSFRTS